MRVEHARSLDGFEIACASRCDRFSLAAFAEVWYTLDQRIADCRLPIADLNLFRTLSLDFVLVLDILIVRCQDAKSKY